MISDTTQELLQNDLWRKPRQSCPFIGKLTWIVQHASYCPGCQLSKDGRGHRAWTLPSLLGWSCIYSCLPPKPQRNKGSWLHDSLWIRCKAYVHVPKVNRESLTTRQRSASLWVMARRQRGTDVMTLRRRGSALAETCPWMRMSAAWNMKSLRQEEISILSWISRVRMIHLLNPWSPINPQCHRLRNSWMFASQEERDVCLSLVTLKLTQVYSLLLLLYSMQLYLLGKGAFSTCHTKWFSGMLVAVKQRHYQYFKRKHVLMEANMLKVCNHKIM